MKKSEQLSSSLYDISEKENGEITIHLKERIDIYKSASILKNLTSLIRAKPPLYMTVDLAGVTYLDDYGAMLLLELKKLITAKKGGFNIINAGTRANKTLSMVDSDSHGQPVADKGKKPANIFVHLGESTIENALNLRFLISFSGSVVISLIHILFHPKSLRILDKDSPVKYMGVCIGRVDSICVAPDAKLIQVVLKIETDLKLDDNVVAQLKSVGITGIMYVEIEKRGTGEPDLSPQIDFPAKYPVIATKPSGIKRFMEGMADVLSQLRDMDTKGIAEKLKSTLDQIKRSIQEAKVKELSADARSSLVRARQIMDSLEKASSSINTLAVNADNAVSHFPF